MAADRASRPALADHATGSRLSVGQCPQALPLGRPWRPMHHYRVQALARAWQRAIMLRLEGMRDTCPARIVIPAQGLPDPTNAHEALAGLVDVLADRQATRLSTGFRLTADTGQWMALRLAAARQPATR